jgi:hypothetical protein
MANEQPSPKTVANHRHWRHRCSKSRRVVATAGNLSSELKTYQVLPSDDWPGGGVR